MTDEVDVNTGLIMVEDKQMNEEMGSSRKTINSHNAQAKAKQISEGMGMGKGKRPHRKNVKTKVAPFNARMTPRSNDTPSSTTGI